MFEISQEWTSEYQTKKDLSTVLVFSDGFGLGAAWYFQKKNRPGSYVLFLSNSTCPGRNNYLKLQLFLGGIIIWSDEPKKIDCNFAICMIWINMQSSKLSWLPIA